MRTPLLFLLLISAAFADYTQGGIGSVPEKEAKRSATNCNCIAFRLENVEDSSYTAATLEMLNVFSAKLTPVTLSIIASAFGSDIQLGSAVRDITRNSSWEVEIASNGYNFLDYSTLPIDQQLLQISTSKRNLEAILTLNPIKTFVPPFGSFNADTLSALTTLNFTHMSSDLSHDAGPYPLSKSRLFRFPSVSSSTGFAGDLLSVSWPELQAAVSEYGFAVMALNPHHFSISQQVPDYDAINALATFVNTVINSTYNIVPIARINTDSPANSTVTGPLISEFNTSCNCVAFRLDDIQDSFARPAQIAVMEVFRRYNVKLSAGIIAYYFDKDPEIVNYVSSALQDPCWPLELFNHGYYHEDFSLLNFTVASDRMNKGQQLILQRLNRVPKTFVPPFNTFNLDTIAACVANGFTHFSANDKRDPPPYVYDGIWRWPMAAQTDDPYNEGYYSGVDHKVTWEAINQQLTLNGFSVVMMHPQEFTEWSPTANYTTIVNATMIRELERLLELTLAHPEIRPVFITEIEEYFNKPLETGTTGKAKACSSPSITIGSTPISTTYQTSVSPQNFKSSSIQLHPIVALLVASISVVFLM